MSLNWVMLSPNGEIVRLPSEQIYYKSPPRMSLSLKNYKTYPGCEPFSFSCPSGNMYLTNRRIIFLPASSSSSSSSSTSSSKVLLPDSKPFQSFAAPLSNLYDSRVTAPWIGPNAWVAIVQPVPNGGIPPSQPALELKLTFREGGAFDFHEGFVRLSERVQQLRDVSASVGAGPPGTEGESGDMHMEDLPQYEPGGAAVSGVGVGVGAGAGAGPGASSGPSFSPRLQDPSSSRPAQQSNQQSVALNSQSAPVQASTTTTSSIPSAVPMPATGTTGGAADPDEPPPGYEEAQMDSLASRVEQDLRQRRYLGESEA